MAGSSTSRWESLPVELRMLGLGGTLGLLIRETTRSERVAGDLAQWVLSELNHAGAPDIPLTAGPQSALRAWQSVTDIVQVLRMEAEAERWAMRRKADAKASERLKPLEMAVISDPEDFEEKPGQRPGDLDGLQSETATAWQIAAGGVVTKKSRAAWEAAPALLRVHGAAAALRILIRAERDRRDVGTVLTRRAAVWRDADIPSGMHGPDAKAPKARDIFHWLDGLSRERAHQVTAGLIRFADLVKQYTRALDLGRL